MARQVRCPGVDGCPGGQRVPAAPAPDGAARARRERTPATAPTSATTSWCRSRASSFLPGRWPPRSPTCGRPACRRSTSCRATSRWRSCSTTCASPTRSACGRTRSSSPSVWGRRWSSPVTWPNAPRSVAGAPTPSTCGGPSPRPSATRRTASTRSSRPDCARARCVSTRTCRCGAPSTAARCRSSPARVSGRRWGRRSAPPAALSQRSASRLRPGCSRRSSPPALPCAPGTGGPPQPQPGSSASWCASPGRPVAGGARLTPPTPIRSSSRPSGPAPMRPTSSGAWTGSSVRVAATARCAAAPPSGSGCGRPT